MCFGTGHRVRDAGCRVRGVGTLTLPGEGRGRPGRLCSEGSPAAPAGRGAPFAYDHGVLVTGEGSPNPSLLSLPLPPQRASARLVPPPLVLSPTHPTTRAATAHGGTSGIRSESRAYTAQPFLFQLRARPSRTRRHPSRRRVPRAAPPPSCATQLPHAATATAPPAAAPVPALPWRPFYHPPPLVMEGGWRSCSVGKVAWSPWPFFGGRVGKDQGGSRTDLPAPRRGGPCAPPSQGCWVALGWALGPGRVRIREDPDHGPAWAAGKDAASEAPAICPQGRVPCGPGAERSARVGPRPAAGETRLALLIDKIDSLRKRQASLRAPRCIGINRRHRAPRRAARFAGPRRGGRVPLRVTPLPYPCNRVTQTKT